MYPLTGLYLFLIPFGLGFVAVGLQKAMEAQLLPIQAILIGTITAIFEGITRGILSNEIPLIFRKEMYATACIIGGIFIY